MKKIEIPGFIHAKPAGRYESGAHVIDGVLFNFWEWEDMKGQGYSFVCPTTLSFDIPDGWDPRPEQVAALEKKRNELTAAFHASVTEIDRQISQLQALEFSPA